jgi:hypothetical protein
MAKKKKEGLQFKKSFKNDSCFELWICSWDSIGLLAKAMPEIGSQGSNPEKH